MSEQTTLEAPSAFLQISLSSILESPTNPRKAFDEQGMTELVESVREKGVIQPILVRPVAGEIGDYYEVVFGARRFRAARAAGIKNIPAQVRHISDQEVLELQITENLQRRDVHPMEEAVAIEALLGYGRNLENIAAILGQSTKYVATRLKLCDLVPAFRNGYLGGFIEHKEARLICTLNADTQEELFKESARHDPDYGTLTKIHIWNLEGYCSKQQRTLNDATFKTEDPELYPAMGACGGCPFNSSNSLMLFVEEGSRICNKPSCYSIKTMRAFTHKLEELQAKPHMLFIDGHVYSDEGKARMKAAGELGISVLKEADYRQVYGTLNTTEKEELKSGSIRKAFSVVGDKFIHIRLNAGVTHTESGVTVGDPVEAEIAGIQQREARAVELDREKVATQVQSFLASDEDQAKLFRQNTGTLYHAEWVGFAQFLWSGLPDDSRKDFGKKLNIKKDSYGWISRGDMALYEALNELSLIQLEELVQAMVRPIILESFPVKDRPDWTRHGEVATLRQIATLYDPGKVAELDAAQEEKASKRKSKVDWRIEGLRIKASNNEAPVETIED